MHFWSSGYIFTVHTGQKDKANVLLKLYGSTPPLPNRRLEGQLGEVQRGAKYLHFLGKYGELMGGWLPLADLRGLIPAMETLAPRSPHARSASHAFEVCCLLVPGTSCHKVRDELWHRELTRESVASEHPTLTGHPQPRSWLYPGTAAPCLTPKVPEGETDAREVCLKGYLLSYGVQTAVFFCRRHSITQLCK